MSQHQPITRAPSTQRFGSGICLPRVDALLSHFQVDRQWLARTSLNITGSNGKGSTASATEAIARAHGLTTGLFTSPHLYRVTERIRVDGIEVTPEEFHASLAEATEAARVVAPSERFSMFELLFVAAVRIFARHRCTCCVFEAGIGGRYDPVRLTKSQVAALTSLDLEHTAILGNTLELIALEKADICASGGVLYCGPNCAPLLPLLHTYGTLQGIVPRVLGADIPFDVARRTNHSTCFRVRLPGSFELECELPLVGDHQAANGALALLLFYEWSGRSLACQFAAEAACRGLSETRWPGRLETISESPLTIIDVGHTPDGIRSAAAGLRDAYPDQRFVLVCGVSEDKDAAGILQLLAPEFPHIICTRAYHKGRSADELDAILTMIGYGGERTVAERIEDAVKAAREVAAKGESGIYVAGGMYLAAEFQVAFQGGDPRSLPHLF